MAESKVTWAVSPGLHDRFIAALQAACDVVRPGHTCRLVGNWVPVAIMWEKIGSPELNMLIPEEPNCEFFIIFPTPRGERTASAGAQPRQRIPDVSKSQTGRSAEFPNTAEIFRPIAKWWEFEA
jgi:hypothetical protein